MGELIEKYKIYLGFVLTFAIILGGVILLWQKDTLNELTEKFSSAEELELANYQKENQDLKERIVQLEEKIVSLEADKQVLAEQDDAGVTGKININTADLAELDKLPGVGPSRAQAIIDYRLQTGGFKTLEEIQNIKGIGSATFAKMKDSITVE